MDARIVPAAAFGIDLGDAHGMDIQREDDWRVLCSQGTELFAMLVLPPMMPFEASSYLNSFSARKRSS